MNDNQFGQFGSQRTVNVAGARENVGSLVVQQSGIQCFNYKKFGHFAKECRKPKRVKDYAYHKEKMLLCKQAEKGELEAHYSYMEKIQEVPTADSGTDSEPLEQDDQNDVECEDERDVLANLIINLKLDAHANEVRKKMWRKLFVKVKPNIFKNIDFLPVLKSISKSRQAYNVMTNNIDHFKEIVDQAWVKHLMDHISLRPPTAHDIQILIKTCLMPLALKTQNDSLAFVYELKQEMLADLKYVESLEKEINDLESDKQNSQTCMIQYCKNVKECDRLALKLSKQTESVSKEVYTELLRRVTYKTNVSRPQHRSNQIKEKVVPNNSQMKLKKTEVEDHPRIPSISNRIKYIVQLILSVVDSGCTKHMTGNLKLLCNFVKKYLGTVRFGNDQFAPILGYGDLVQGNITINKVYYVEGLNHNLFSVGQFCDADLEVAFWKSTCFVRDLQGNDLLTGNRGSNLYTISLQETTSLNPLCLMAKASPTQAWLWHRRLSHLNFDCINLLSKKDAVIGLPKLKYVKDQLCSSCKVSKAKRSSFKTNTILSSKGRLNLLHMDLCGPMRVASINGKKYILVIIDDYSRYTWTLFLHSKDETPKVLKDFLMMIQRNLQAPSKGYHVLNKRTRLIVESIHLRFDEIKEMSETSIANDTSGLVPQQQMALDYDNSDPVPQIQHVLPSSDTSVPS
nr:integrase, catalytic region, zinc finger, CCHC-type, peptidase aspartic, catalytic [Tanacetum cinerariifolium]